MDTILRGGRIIDGTRDQIGDLVIRDGAIAPSDYQPAPDAEVIDVAGKVVTPGLVDIHVHFREPGHEYKEDVASGARSAAAGGFTTVCCMPNTKPVNDCRAVTDLIVQRAREANGVHVHPIGAISKGLRGEHFAEYGEMKDAGIVAISDDGLPVMSAGFMRRALEYAKTFDLCVVQHAEDLTLAEGGVMNEGEVSTRIGLKGQPTQAESVMVARDIELVQWTGGKYHVAHVSAARTIELVRDAKRRGLPVTCEVAPHHFTLTDESCASYNTDTKVMPPLRRPEDIAAIKEGLADGTVDCIATDHAPHSDVEKQVEFSCASPGMLGLETSVPLTLGLVREGVISLGRAVELLTRGGAGIFGLDAGGAGQLQAGGPADIAVIDLERQWMVERSDSRSKSANTPFHGMQMVGQAVMTFVGGKLVFDRDNIVGAGGAR